MRIEKIKTGQQVRDSWFSDWGVGRIVKVLKTRVKIKFTGRADIVTYDLAHLQFLVSV
jgi:hypothetical protein